MNIPERFVQDEPEIASLLTKDPTFLEMWNDYQAVFSALQSISSHCQQDRDLRELKSELEQDIHEALKHRFSCDIDHPMTAARLRLPEDILYH